MKGAPGRTPPLTEEEERRGQGLRKTANKYRDNRENTIRLIRSDYMSTMIRFFDSRERRVSRFDYQRDVSR